MDPPSDVFEDEFFTCGICFERFTQPKSLPCLHTFCLHCLRSYIQSTVLCENKTAFRCPTCRDLVRVPQPTNSDWAEQFKTNFYVNNLMEAASKVMLHSSSTSSYDEQPQANEKLCSLHAGKIMDIFCVDCNKTVCLQCSVISHRSCRQVIPISKIATSKRAELEKHRAQVEGHLNKCGHVVKQIDKERNNLVSERERIKSLIIGQSAHLLKSIQIKTQHCISRLESVSLENDELLKSELLTNQQLFSDLRNSFNEMNRSIDGPDTKIVDGLDSFLSQKDRLLAQMPEAFNIPVFKYLYECSAEVLIPIGDFKVKSERRLLLFKQDLHQKEDRSRTNSVEKAPCQSRQKETSAFSVPSNNLTFMSKMDTKMKGDKHTSCLRDIAVLRTGTIVVTDSTNNCVKAFQDVTTTGTSKYSTGMPPHAIAVMLSENKIAITVPKAKKIFLFNVTPVLVLEEQISVSKKYWGVTNVGGEVLAVSTCPGTEPGVIDLISLKGIHIKTVHSVGFFSNPLYLTASSTMNIIVSDCTVQKVAALRQNGDILFGKERRSDVLSRPMGMSCDSSDTILIVDAGLTVVVMDEDGTVKRKFNLESKSTKKETIRSIAVYGKDLYVATENSHIFSFHLE